MAKLYFRYGAMGSSKSANILMVRYNYEERGQYAVLLKPRTDNRDGEREIQSRIGLSAPAEYVDDFLKEISETWSIGSDEYLHGAMAGKAGGNTIYNVRCHCVGILFLQIPKTFGKGGIHTAAVLQFSCVELFDCRQYLSMYSGDHI